MIRNKLLLIGFAVFTMIAANANAATVHEFKQGDTLWELSAKYYGDPELYPILLEVNGINNPRTIQNGKKILIPTKDDLKKVAKEKNPSARKRLIKEAVGLGAASSATSKKEKTTVAPSENQADSVSRTGKKITGSVSFKNILKGPKVSADKLIDIK